MDSVRAGPADLAAPGSRPSGGRRSWWRPPRCSGAATRPRCGSRRWRRPPGCRARWCTPTSATGASSSPRSTSTAWRGVDADLSALLRDGPVDEAGLAVVVRSYLRLAAENADSWRLFAAGAIAHPAVQEARKARCQRIADTWGGGPAERLGPRPGRDAGGGGQRVARAQGLQPRRGGRAADRGRVERRRAPAPVPATVRPERSVQSGCPRGILAACLVPCGAAPSASGWSTSRSSCSTRCPARTCTSTRSTPAPGPASSTGRCPPPTARRCPTRPSPRATSSPPASTCWWATTSWRARPGGHPLDRHRAVRRPRRDRPDLLRRRLLRGARQGRPQALRPAGPGHGGAGQGRHRPVRHALQAVPGGPAARWTACW